MAQFSNLKRALAALMVVMMLVGIMPANVFAGRVVVGGDNSQVIVSDITLEEAIAKMEAIYVKYLGEKYLYEDEINAAVAQMDYATLASAKQENDRLEAEMKNLSDEDIAFINECYTPYINFASAINARMGGRQMARTNTEIMTGLIFADSANSSSYSGGTYSATAKGSLFSKKTNTVTISNTTDVTKKLSFSY